MVSGCIGSVQIFALTFGRCPSLTAGFVRKVSRIFQVFGTTRACCCREADDAECISGSRTSKFSASAGIRTRRPRVSNLVMARHF